MRFKSWFMAAGLMLASITAFAQQPSPADLQAALSAAQAQRNRLADEQLEMAVRLQRMAADYEARLSTAMQWLQDAQSACRNAK